MKIATWNVNSLKVRLLQVLQWLKDNPVDILCLQETKLTDEKFPLTEIEAAGYQAVFYRSKNLQRESPFLQKKRHPTSSGTIRFFRTSSSVSLQPHSAEKYASSVPMFQTASPVGSDKYRYKIEWLRALRNWLEEEKKKYPYLALLGDYSIAPEDRDVYDPVAWAGNVLVSELERVAFRALLDIGLVDAFRLFEQPEKSYSWWDYRQLAFPRNRGLRLDPIFAFRKTGLSVFSLYYRPPAPEMETAFRPYSCYRRTRSLNSANNGKR